MRPEHLYLIDMRDAAASIAAFLDSIDRESFTDDDLVRSAVLHKLTIIGEAAARLPRTFRERYPDIPWADIVGFRNIAVHAYFAVDWAIIWTTATSDVPGLADHITATLEQEWDAGDAPPD